MIRAGAADCQGFTEEPLKIRQIQTTIKIQIGEFIANPAQRFLVYLSHNALKTCSIIS